MLQLKLKGTGIQYALEKQKTRVKALFNIGNNTQVEMFVTHKKFPEQITSVVNTLTAIKQLVGDTGITISMKRVSRGVSWKEVYSYFFNSSGITGIAPFWVQTYALTLTPMR